MEDPEIKERIEEFIYTLINSGFTEVGEDERMQYIYFYAGTPKDTKIFEKGNISVWVYNENINKAEVYLNENQFLGKRNFTDFIYG